MDTTPLQPIVRTFLDSQTTDPFILEQQEDHDRRKEAAQQLLVRDRISTLTRQELQAFLIDTDAYYGVRGREQLWINLFGQDDELLPAVRQALLDLVESAEADLTASDFNAFCGALKGIGSAYASELLALRFPDRYWLWNGPIRQFLKDQDVDIKEELAWGKKGDEGEQYLAAGRHLADLRRAISDAADEPVDNLFTDLFVYWAVQYEAPLDPWAERIAQRLQRDMPPERLQARLDGEERARALLEEKHGRFTEADVRQCFKDFNTDWWDGKTSYRRFMPALYGNSVKGMVESLDAFNTWVQRLWQAEDDDLDGLLHDFWRLGEVTGAGISLPTALLYLRDPERYAIWLPILSKAMQFVSGFAPGKFRTVEGYHHYNAAAQAFRTRYKISPQAFDVVLWWIAQIGDDGKSAGFRGFTEDTSRFLNELAENNTSEWMHADEDTNEMRYRRALREPLRLLFEAAAPTIKNLDPSFETAAKFGRVMASIKKRWPDDEGPYHTYLWGAFYRQGRSKQTDAQLFVNVHPDHVNVGFSVAGARGSDVLENFHANLRGEPDFFLRLYSALPEDIFVATRETHGQPEKEAFTLRTQEDLQRLGDVEVVDILRRYPFEDPLLLEPSFADEVVALFKDLYPLYRFATSDLAELADLRDEGEIEQGDPVYTLDQLCRDTYLDEGFWAEFEFLLADKRQIILHGPPGTGKTWLARSFADYWVDSATSQGGDVKVVQFHPSYAYEEFVEGIRPKSEEGQDGRRELSYPVQRGLFRDFCDQARLHPQQRYVLILDEINRGELPRIFGELLYLLEYRNEVVTLPYSGKPFSIPSNLYLIGTMNTADRSIALVDHALRRRFHFFKLEPDPEVLRAYFAERPDLDMAWTADLLEMLNNQLENDGIEWHLHIGHSHFMRPRLDDRMLRVVWEHSIIPTLEEHFYRQPRKLQAYKLVTLRDALGDT